MGEGRNAFAEQPALRPPLIGREHQSSSGEAWRSVIDHARAAAEWQNARQFVRAAQAWGGWQYARARQWEAADKPGLAYWHG